MIARLRDYLRAMPPSTRVAIGITVIAIAYAYGPFLAHGEMLGNHDWDQMEAHRYLVQKSILHYHQFPFWNPYACGGFTAWGGLESDSVVISPWLPAYLIMSLASAIRIEIVGSAIIGAFGAWLLAARFVRSPALRALVTILWVVNIRHFLQISVGHTWHLTYAWVPWVFLFYDRAQATLARRDIAGGAIALAMMAYTGAIYPLPQVALVLVVYALAQAALSRSWRPIIAAASSGLLGVALAAPKLLPTFEVVKRFPRLVPSNEIFPLEVLYDALATRTGQSDPTRYVGPQMWHEWGMYVGLGVVVWLVWGALASGGKRLAILKWLALGALLVALGAFGPHSPWYLLHQLPVFSSQHVPMRWLYFALLPAALVAAGATELALGRLRRIGHIVEVVLLLAVAYVAVDVAPIAHTIAGNTFVHAPAAMPASYGTIETYHALPRGLDYEPGAYNLASLPAELMNIATTDCNMFSGLANPNRATRRPRGLGAYGKGDAQYRGEAWIDGTGSAEITEFSPNAIEVQLHDASGRVVLNQNWDAGWHADGDAVENHGDIVSAPVPSPNATIRFTYTPSTWWMSLAIFGLGLAAIALLCSRRLWGKVIYSARCLRRRTS